MLSKPASSGYFSRPGIYPALLEAIECYTESDYKNKEIKKPSFTFILNLGDVDNKSEDVLFKQGFVFPPVDNDGVIKMAGERSRYYQLVSSAYGERFDPEDDDVKIEVGFPEEYDSPEGIFEMPSYQAYEKGEDRLKLTHFKINGKNIIGAELNVELGFADNPQTGVKSAKISVVNATPIVKQVRRTSNSKLPAGAPA